MKDPNRIQAGMTLAILAELQESGECSDDVLRDLGFTDAQIAQHKPAALTTARDRYINQLAALQ